MATHLQSVAPKPDRFNNLSLPGWLYHDAEFHEAEKKAFLRAAPQVVCHESEIANPGECRGALWAAAVHLEDDGENLSRSPPHPRGPPGPDPPVRAQLSDRGAGTCRPDGRRPGRERVRKPLRARVPASPPTRRASARK